MKKAYTILGLILALTLCLTLFACNKSGESYKTAIENYVNALMGDADAYWNIVPEKKFMAAMEEEGMTLQQARENVEYAAGELKEEMEETFGKNIRYSIQYYSEEQMNREELAEQEQQVNREYGTDMQVTQGYYVEGEITIRGSYGEEIQEFEMTVLKIDGKWYASNER